MVLMNFSLLWELSLTLNFLLIFLFFKLESLNLGNNKLEVLPEVLSFLSGLQRLHLFNNKLSELNSVVLSK